MALTDQVVTLQSTAWSKVIQFTLWGTGVGLAKQYTLSISILLRPLLVSTHLRLFLLHSLRSVAIFPHPSLHLKVK